MLRALNLIEKNNHLCSQHNFFEWLRKPEFIQNEKDVLSFAPSMTFFVLGFKDILESIKLDNPKTEIEKIINIHCHEDSQHWLWFLDDLTKLGLDDFYKHNNASEMFKMIWSDENFAIREMVYNTIYRIKEAKNPKISLVIIEVLEAAFDTFMDSLSTSLKGTELFRQLSYFGEKHQEQEANHAMGSWANADMLETRLKMIELNEEESYQAEVIIIEMFGLFDEIFKCWFDSKDKLKPLSHYYTPEVKSNLTL